MNVIHLRTLRMPIIETHIWKVPILLTSKCVRCSFESTDDDGQYCSCARELEAGAASMPHPKSSLAIAIVGADLSHQHCWVVFVLSTVT
jgi:hypothetical protein